MKERAAAAAAAATATEHSIVAPPTSLPLLYSYAPRNLPLLPGSPRIDGFHVLIVGLPQGRDKAEINDMRNTPAQ